MAGGYYGDYSARVSMDGHLYLSIVDTQGRTQASCTNTPVCGSDYFYVAFNTFGVSGFFADPGDGNTRSHECRQNFPAF